MMRQGCCLDSTPDALTVVDRLVGLSKVISPAVMEQALLETDRSEQRACRLSHRVMLWVVLAMGVLTNLPIRMVFKHARRMRLGDAETPSRSNLCEARQRLGVEPVRRVFELAVKPLATPETPGAFYHALRLVGIDGTVLDVPDTPANDAHFGRSSNGYGDGAFPQLRKVSLVELGTRVEFAVVMGSYRDREQILAERLWDRIPSDALLLEDRGFFSYKHWKTLNDRGIKLLIRLKKDLILRPIERLPDGSFLSKIYRSPQDRDRDRNGIMIRVIEYTLNDPQRTGHDEVHRLGTNLFDHTLFPALELACLYHERWEEELTFDEQKTHQDPRRPTKPTHLRSKTPAGVEQEVYALSIGHFVVRSLMVQAAEQEHIDVDRLSFTGCLEILRARLPECDSTNPERLEQWYQLLLAEMAKELIDPRRNRVNPRVVKRRASKFPKARPDHRGRPPMQKSFAETVVIT
jgi:Insertion element 4 transposase N-terminal/Transposase DDE domain